MQVVTVPLLLGHLPSDNAQGEAGEQHQEADGQEARPDYFGLPAPILKKRWLSLGINKVRLVSKMIEIKTK